MKCGTKARLAPKDTICYGQKLKEREQWRAAYMARALRVRQEELESVDRGETPESYERVVRAVSS
jgi:hypothetical protein